MTISQAFTIAFERWKQAKSLQEDKDSKTKNKTEEQNTSNNVPESLIDLVSADNIVSSNGTQLDFEDNFLR